MLPGPVFNVEVLTTARRARYYALRFFYGAILLAIVWQNDPAHYSWYYGTVRAEMTLQQAADLGLWLFRSFAVAQSIAVLLMTPAFVAGVIAEEKQRKTLHYLLASRLTSGEIVLGKLCARLLHVGVLVGVGLPVLSLLSLFGGVPPELIMLTFVATLTTIFFVAAFSMLISVYARRPREAIGLVYVVELAWLFLPLVLSEVLPMGGGVWVEIYDWIRPINDLIGSSGPLYSLTRMFIRSRTGWEALNTYLWMVGLQAGMGVLCLIVAVARLRPVFRGQGDVSRWAARIGMLKQGRRLLPRPLCGDDPMLWKERYVSRTSAVTKLVGGVIVLALGGVLLYSMYDWVAPAIQELREYGYGSVTQHSHRDDLNRFIRFLSAFAYGAWVLGIASAASSGVVFERESDTWTSLIATPLEGYEIMRAKLIGALWGTRWIGFGLLALFTLGLATGAVHPLGYIAAIIETTIFVWFAAALGTFISLRAKNSGRAMTTTIGILVLLNGGYTLCCAPLRPDSMFIVVGVTPVLQALSLVTYEDMRHLTSSQYSGYGFRHYVESFMACVVGTFGYTVGAIALTISSIGLFDDAADRPRRYGQYPPHGLRFGKSAEGEEIEFID